MTTKHQATRERRQDRRKGPDLLVRSLPFFGAVTALVVTITLAILAASAPSAYSRIEPRARLAGDMWKDGLLDVLFYVLVVGAAAGAIGLVVNLRRSRRKGDRIRLNLIFLLVISLVGIGLYLTIFA